MCSSHQDHAVLIVSIVFGLTIMILAMYVFQLVDQRHQLDQENAELRFEAFLHGIGNKSE